MICEQRQAIIGGARSATAAAGRDVVSHDDTAVSPERDQRGIIVYKFGDGMVSTAAAAQLHVYNNNNSHDNVYGAVVMTKVSARVHPVHLMNVD